jgi:putative salt-induced outer membrane protein
MMPAIPHENGEGLDRALRRLRRRLRRALGVLIAGAALMPAARVHAQNAAASPTHWQADLGYVSASGNTDVTTMNVGDKITRLMTPWTFTQTGSYIYGRTKGKESANQLRLGLRADASFNGAVGAFLAVAYERNVYAGFSSRYDELLGIQWRAIRRKQDSLTVDGGGVLTEQENTLGQRERLPAARTAVNYKHQFSNKASFQHLAEVIPDVKTGGHFRVNSETAMVAPLSEHMSLKVRWATRFNSAPPAGFGTTDRVFTAGVQVAY